jgi:hypothetical protein
MNKTAIKNFAVWARNKLIADISYKAGLMGISEEEIKEALPQSTKDTEFYDIGTKEPYVISGEAVRQRKRLSEIINQKAVSSDYKTAYGSVIEETAYTWFNRMIAIRFMEVNDYLPSRIRVLSSESGAKLEPDLVTTPFDADLKLSDHEQSEVVHLKNENKVNELFHMLFVKQCNALNEILPKLFEKTSDYTELLLNVSVTDQDGIVYHLVHDIPEDDFNIEKGGQVEIIGWLYQYYNTEPKDEAFALLKKNVKITRERIPAATQLFTPDWIVRYMVENSLGRLWLEGHPNSDLNASWKYYLDEAEQEADVQMQLEKIRDEYKTIKPEEIKVIDPCMGSGHILVYAFDVLMQIYESAGHTQREAAMSILENNIYGLDIDDRAFQLSYFAVMMKARQYNRRILSEETVCHVYSIQESNTVNRNHLKYFGAGMSSLERDDTMKQLTELLDTFDDAKEYGSILNVKPCNWNLLHKFLAEGNEHGQMSLDTIGLDRTREQIYLFLRIGQIMAQKYDVVITNPPYMGSDSMDTRLSNYVKKLFPQAKADLYAVFMETCGRMLKVNGLQSMITQHSWMFLSSFEKLRCELLESKTFLSMVHLGARAFEEISGEVVQTVAWVMRNHTYDYKAIYCRLVDQNSQSDKEKTFLQRKNIFFLSQSKYRIIPGSPIAYWISPSLQKLFASGHKITEYVSSRDGLTTGNNERFIKQFWEVDFHNIQFNSNNAESFWKTGRKYAPLIKGGLYRKWYGNNWFVITYGKPDYEILSKCGNKLPSREVYFLPYISWNRISTRMAFRYSEAGYIFESASLIEFSQLFENAMFALAFFNSKLANCEMELINPTTNMLSGYVDQLCIPDIAEKEYCIGLARSCIKISKEDWDSFETSWDFSCHPLVHGTSVKKAFEAWKVKCDERFEQIKRNEENLNMIFLEASGLSDELSVKVEDGNVSIRRADEQRDIKGLLSYAIGCIFGRYSLDDSGLAYAGGAWDASKYSSFIPDKDNILPITDEEYFEDDIVGQFCVWLKKVYGAETLEENLDFIANALGSKSNTSREAIRNYFLNDFIRDHIKAYQKRPIYWLFDSGKQNGFKALIYMHRYDENTIGNLRIDYLHRMERVYDSEIARMQHVIDNSSDAREVIKAAKRKEKLQKQVKECKEYDEKIAHLALDRISIDLDDGVKVNYEKVQTVDGKKYQVLAII